jgi:hypothetical protein
MSITATKITTTSVLKGANPAEALPVISKDFNKVIDDLNTLDESVTDLATAVTTTTLTADDAIINDDLTVTGDTSLTGLFLLAGTPQTLTGAGAVNLTTKVTLLVTTAADALTLAAGTDGQIKIITMKTDGGDGTLTPTGLRGGTTITFNDVGDTVTLLYKDSAWLVLSNFGCTIA